MNCSVCGEVLLTKEHAQRCKDHASREIEKLEREINDIEIEVAYMRKARRVLKIVLDRWHEVGGTEVARLNEVARL